MRSPEGQEHPFTGVYREVVPPSKLVWTGRVLTTLCVPLFLMGAVMMITKNPQALEGMAKYGWPASAISTIAALELGSLILYLIPQTAVLGAVLLTGYLGGAVATHLRAGEAPTMAVVVGVIVWAGLWLREPRLRALMPFRKS
ncbi:MAG: DoxX family protein [Elusimicrobia bacterium]|nr:DoxX family protein [Elusimicrobiota bacterium]MDE2509598.1 DoxX family protein [Elusimicrobiota bacterium]